MIKIGREVKRVPKEFEWPLKKTWWGYLLDEISCQACGETGKTSKGELCPLCYGERRVSPRVDVPDGDYYQMWEDTSEGSPISPPFRTPQQLAKWLTENNASACGDQTATYDEWLGMIKVGSAPCYVITNGQQKTGVAAVSDGW